MTAMLTRVFLMFAVMIAVPVAGDAPALPTLAAQVAAINAGTFANNFYDGGFVQAGATEEQQVGGCLLDKVQAIQNENGMASFPNDLKVDLGACCTKGNSAACITSMSPVYTDISTVQASGSTPALVSNALTILKAQAASRLAGTTLVTGAKKLLESGHDEP
eukprot:TRINITY_DN50104_c0_g1_i1.p2 TRINITY_DN50104_c0_g1~~TRINITY_DN50104_c0_g1_i1.p2  ORF type:complete len:162 (-),score=40.95 TRINITY_DN50104_c0_g1_i1:400-885(-)